MIYFTNASSNPKAMMIKLMNAFLTNFAMLHSQILELLAEITKIIFLYMNGLIFYIILIVYL